MPIEPSTATGQKPPPSPEALLRDSARSARLGLWALAMGFGGFILWAALAPLDEGVPTQGMVVLDTKRKAVQHLSGGLVKEVLVREGDIVAEGQPLIRLDDMVAKANFQMVRQRYLASRATEARLMAEQTKQARIAFHPDLVQAGSDPGIAQQMQNQVRLLDSRRSSLAAELMGIQESIKGLEGQIKSNDAILLNRQNQLALLNQELGSLRDLVKEGYAPRNRQLELERMVAESSAVQSDLLGNMLRTRQAIAEIRQRAIARQQDYQKEVETQLAEVTRDAQSDAVRMLAVTDELSRSEVRAPSQGQVVALSVQTIGGVINAGQKLMDIVPENAPLLIETRVAPHLIDRVRASLPVDIRFGSFAHTPQLVIEGKVLSVSKDLLTDPQTNASYYLARIGLTPQGVAALGKRQLQAGMPAEVVIKTGERSMLTYLLHPLTKRIAASMKEE
ncbi:MAG: HlyD family type I secretion periplasmic adaptor subunit [Hylemonella sp.]|nr:HlyD family type I secretion periplasmic adaptor subunit [Hylemonella sp.]